MIELLIAKYGQKELTLEFPPEIGLGGFPNQLTLL